MKNFVTIMLLTLVLLIFASNVRAEDQGWSLMPFDLKDNYTQDSEDVFTADWGVRLNAPYGRFQAQGQKFLTADENRFSLGYSKEFGAWFLNPWGKIDQTEKYTLYDKGLKVRWENKYIYGETSLADLGREPEKSDYQYGYKGWESNTNWGLQIKNGVRFKMEFNRKKLDYFQTDDSSDKLELESSLRFKVKDSRWYLLWKEWKGDYPDNPIDNLWGSQGKLEWSQRFELQKMTINFSETQIEQGNGLNKRQEKIEWADKFYFMTGTLTLRAYLAHQKGQAWIEDYYNLDEEQEEYWNLGITPGWKSDFSYRREIGLHRCWKFGGYCRGNDGKEYWGIHTEWDYYIGGSWRLRFNLHGSGKEDQENPAGAWIKLTYYF